MIKIGDRVRHKTSLRSWQNMVVIKKFNVGDMLGWRVEYYSGNRKVTDIFAESSLVLLNKHKLRRKL